MKYQIDTVPVWDAYKEGGECPLCSIRNRVEEMEIGYFLGDSYMEPDQRIDVNQKYFCADHLKCLYEESNRLGLALMTHTHIKNMLPGLNKNADNLATAAKKDGLKPAPLRKNLKSQIQVIRELTGRCVLCERLKANIERYEYTILHLFGHDQEFQEAFRESKGLCLEHYADLLEMAANHLNGKTLAEFVDVLTKAETENFKRLEGEVEWFTLKFDYRNGDKPWGNSKDSVKRCVNKLRHETVQD